MNINDLERNPTMKPETFQCRECGADESPANWSPSVRPELIGRQLCFRCNHWHNWWLRRNSPHVARIDGTHYYIRPNDPDSPFQGFGGRQFFIYFPNDERTISTRNLWCQGDIPPRWRERLPDNAKFLTQE